MIFININQQYTVLQANRKIMNYRSLFLSWRCKIITFIAHLS